MRRVPILLMLAVALCASPPAEARKRDIPGAVFDTVTAPFRIIAGAISGRRHARARHHRFFAFARQYRLAEHSRTRAAAIAPGLITPTPDLPQQAPQAAPETAPPAPIQTATTGAETRKEPRTPTFQRWMAPSGWVGPLYWPYASDDLFDFVFSPSRGGDWFWTRGSGDLVDAIFMRGGDSKAAWADMCGGRRGGSNVWVDPIRQAVEPTAAQLQALETVRAALVQAGNEIRLVCPAADAVADPDQRLEAMTDRLWGLRQAVTVLRPPLEAFVSSLTGNQQARLNAIKDEAVARPITTTGSVGQQANTQACTVPASPFADWPADLIDQRLRPDDEQRQALETLRLTTLGMTQVLMVSCPSEAPDTPLIRLTAAEQRLDALLYAARVLAPAVHAFYGTLNDEQKAAFANLGRSPAIGRQPSAVR